MTNNLANEPDELCASMYSFHSSPEEKNKLLYALTQHGIETTVDRVAKKKRIRDWIQESVIQEDNEEENDDEENDGKIIHTQRAPVAGHVSSVRAQEKAARTQIVSTVKDASNKHINPRTGKIQLGPSEMGHQSDSHRSSAHHIDNNEKSHEFISYTNQIDNSNANSNSNVELRNNGYDHQQVTRRSSKSVDVGSQTAMESQKQLEMVKSNRTFIPERPIPIGEVYTTKNSQSVPTVSHTPVQYSNSKHQNTQTYLSRMDTTSRGFMSAFNSLATVAVPESQQTQQSSLGHLQPVSSRDRDRDANRDRSQPRKSYQQRHNTTALTKQPISRSVHNFNNSIVNDSGYGSVDKLRQIDTKNLKTSPTLSKRSIVPSKLVTPSNGSANETIHINGLSHSQKEYSSPFHSDSDGDDECSPRGSNGFFNHAGTKRPTTNISTETNNLRMSMKDTAYDRVMNNDPIRGSRKKR